VLPLGQHRDRVFALDSSRSSRVIFGIVVCPIFSPADAVGADLNLFAR